MILHRGDKSGRVRGPSAWSARLRGRAPSATSSRKPPCRPGSELPTRGVPTVHPSLAGQAVASKPRPLVAPSASFLPRGAQKGVFGRVGRTAGLLSTGLRGRNIQDMECVGAAKLGYSYSLHELITPRKASRRTRSPAPLRSAKGSTSPTSKQRTEQGPYPGACRDSQPGGRAGAPGNRFCFRRAAALCPGHGGRRCHRPDRRGHRHRTQGRRPCHGDRRRLRDARGLRRVPGGCRPSRSSASRMEPATSRRPRCR